MTGRERLTMAHLRAQTARLYHEATMKREDRTLSITHDEFMDLRCDKEFFHCVEFAVTSGIPREFNVNGIRVVIK